MVQLTEVAASTEKPVSDNEVTVVSPADATPEPIVDLSSDMHPVAEEIMLDDDNDDDYEDAEDIVELEHYDAESEKTGAGLDLQAPTYKTMEDDSDDDDDDVLEESLLERLAALVDVVPPTARAHMYNTVAHSMDLTFLAGRLLGFGAWVIATGGILVFLPLALSVEREQVAIMQDQQMRQQQQVAQQVG
ncbi:hypothetical protein BSLG_000682 [Batrachochytrium salamandrivorans]|nr:hypothetical protein BSLG_000682 [Batrachochytrium salamandrivorans]